MSRRTLSLPAFPLSSSTSTKHSVNNIVTCSSHDTGKASPKKTTPKHVPPALTCEPQAKSSGGTPSRSSNSPTSKKNLPRKAMLYIYRQTGCSIAARSSYPPDIGHFSKPSIPTIKLTSQSSRTETGQLRFGEMELLLSLPTSVYSISRVVFLVLFECRVVILPRSWEKRARSPANFMEIYISWWIDTMFVVHTGVLDTHPPAFTTM